MSSVTSNNLSICKSIIESLDPTSKVTLCRFDKAVTFYQRDVVVKDINLPSPRSDKGVSALMDAMSEIIRVAEIHEPHLWSDQDDNRVSIIVMADVCDNSSKHYSLSYVKDVIAYRMTQEWNFVFMTKDEDVAQQYVDFGASPDSIILYTNDTFDHASKCVVELIGKHNATETSLDF